MPRSGDAVPDLSSRHGRSIRLAALSGVVFVLLTGLATILLFPAAFVAAFTGVAGIRLVNKDSDAAVLRLGVSVIASSVVAVFTLVSAPPVLGWLGAGAAAAFTVAWRRMSRLRDERRRTWAVDHKDRWQRLQQLHARKDAVPAPPEEPTSDDGAWWEDLD